MELLGRVLAIVLLSILYQGKTKAQFTLDTKPADVVYVEAGKTLRLDVTFTYTGFLTLTLTWSLNGKTLVQKVGNGKPVSAPPGRANIEGQGSFVLKNTSLHDNGTYRFSWGGSAVGNDDFTAIILVRSKANILCTGKGDDFSCLCKGIGGNPPPSTSWSKNGVKIKGPGHLVTKLEKADIVNGREGVYYCNSSSGRLTNVTVITLSKVLVENVFIKIEPLNPVIGDTVTITCSSTVYPPPDYILYRNGTTIPNNGGVRSESVKEKGAINYTCKARNIFATVNKSKVVEVEVKPTGQPTSEPTTNNRHSPSSISTNKPVGTKESSGGLGTGAIVGIVIGSLFVVILIAALIYWFCCKGSSKSTEQRVPVVSNADGSVAGSLSRANDDNAYESVDQEKLRREAAARNEGNGGDGDGSTLPVYAVVDKTKKKKEKKPAQPTYASLDPVALQPDSSKMRDRSREETNYASINLDSLQSDLV